MGKDLGATDQGFCRAQSMGAAAQARFPGHYDTLVLLGGRGDGQPPQDMIIHHLWHFILSIHKSCRRERSPSAAITIYPWGGVESGSRRRTGGQRNAARRTHHINSDGSSSNANTREEQVWHEIRQMNFNLTTVSQHFGFQYS